MVSTRERENRSFVAGPVPLHRRWPTRSKEWFAGGMTPSGGPSPAGNGGMRSGPPLGADAAAGRPRPFFVGHLGTELLPLRIEGEIIMAQQRRLVFSRQRRFDFSGHDVPCRPIDRRSCGRVFGAGVARDAPRAIKGADSCRARFGGHGADRFDCSATDQAATARSTGSVDAGPTARVETAWANDAQAPSLWIRLPGDDDGGNRRGDPAAGNGA